MGRSPNGLLEHREHASVIGMYQEKHCNAAHLKKDILERVGINIAHGTIHKIMLEEKLAMKETKKSKRRKWVRYERTTATRYGTQTTNY